VSFWLVNGELLESEIAKKKAWINSSLVNLYVTETKEHASCSIQLFPLQEAYHQRSAPAIYTHETAVGAYQLSLDRRPCSDASKWAFLTALAVWLQAQYDAKQPLDERTVSNAVDRLRIEYLEPIA